MNKGRAKVVSASSFLDLKAELSKKEDELRRNKAAGKTNTGGLKKTLDKVCPRPCTRINILFSFSTENCQVVPL